MKRITVETKVGSTWMVEDVCTFEGTHLSDMSPQLLSAMGIVPETVSPETVSSLPAKRQGKFTVPSVEECVAYSLEVGLPSDEGEAFHDYFTANGWKVCQGRAPMVDWKAGIRTWKKNFKQRKSQEFQRPKPGVGALVARITNG